MGWFKKIIGLGADTEAERVKSQPTADEPAEFGSETEGEGSKRKARRLVRPFEEDPSKVSTTPRGLSFAWNVRHDRT